MDTSPDTTTPDSTQEKGLGKEGDLWSLSPHWESALYSGLSFDYTATHGQKCHCHSHAREGAGLSHSIVLRPTSSLLPSSTQGSVVLAAAKLNPLHGHGVPAAASEE